MENRLFAVKTPHEMLDCCFLFASRLLVSGQWYIGVGHIVDGGAYHLYDVLLTDGDVTVLPHPHSAPAWEIPYERIAELPKPYRGSEAEIPLLPRLLSQMDKYLLPVHDESVLYPYRVLSCLSADSAVAEYFLQKEELATASAGRRTVIRLRLDELQEDMEDACARLRLSLTRLKLLYRALCRWSRRHGGARFPLEAHKDKICDYLREEKDV
ncbi:hypothetical protein [Agathobaculum sp. TL06]